MTAAEMSTHILQYICEVDGSVTFVQLLRRLGTEAEGEMALFYANRPNNLLWAGVSETFADAFALCVSKLELHITEPLVYAVDGGLLRFPIARRPNHAYTTPHWQPLTLWPLGSLRKLRRQQKERRGNF